MEPTKFYKVVAKHIDTGKTKYWKYTAVTTEGKKVVIRAKATKFYTFAFQYSVEAGVGKGDSRFFTFGQKPNPYFAGKLIHRFNVQIEEEVV